MLNKVQILFICILLFSTCKKEPVIQYSLKVSVLPVEGGTASPLTELYKEGEIASITAVPSAEYLFIEIRCRFKQQCSSFLFPFLFCTEPAFQKLFFGVG